MRILVGISGGVDSAVAAKRLLSLGNTVEGAVLIMHEHTELSAARDAAESIGIKLHEIDCRERFNIIKENFVNEYVKGRTPNPCIICNERVKFARLYEFALEQGFDAIATGHYATVVENDHMGNKRFSLKVSQDVRKDQTYMLYRLPQHILSKLILPLGECSKEDVRKYASIEGISAANRSDSQEICFLPEGNHTDYIEKMSGKCPEGDFIDEKGRILGRHKGIIHYTVGQRKGLGISLGERAFVTEINPQNNTVTLSNSMSGKLNVKITDIVFMGMDNPDYNNDYIMDVKLRYTAVPVRASVRFFEDNSAMLSFDEPKKSAPGQSAVLYENGIVMCGGFILG